MDRPNQLIMEVKDCLFKYLPRDILQRIFSCLDVHTVLGSSMICNRWCAVASEPSRMEACADKGQNVCHRCHLAYTPVEPLPSAIDARSRAGCLKHSLFRHQRNPEIETDTAAFHSLTDFQYDATTHRLLRIACTCKRY